VIEHQHRENFSQHLRRDSKTQSQLANIKCFFDILSKWRIQCLCVDNSSFALIVSIKSLNLVYVSLILLSQWISQMQEHLNLHDDEMNWEIRFAYEEISLQKKIHELKLQKNDRPEFYKYNDQRKHFIDDNRLIYVIIIQSFFKHLDKLWTNYDVTFNIKREKSFIKTFKDWRSLSSWDRVTCDEAHNEVKRTSSTIKKFTDLNAKTRRWMITETSMKQSSTQMIYWLNSIENWTQLNTNTEWKAQDRHRKKLEKYMFSLIIALDKFHETIVNRSIENHEQIKTHIDKMIDFISTVSLMQTCEHSTFIDDESLIDVSSTTHIKITVQLSSQYDTIINESMNAHKKVIKRIYENKLTAWKRHNELDEKSKVEIQEYLVRVRILRILSSFSRLLQLKTTKHLFLIDEYSKEQR